MVGDEEQSSTAGIPAIEGLSAAVAWAAERGFRATRIEPLRGDVSARRYVRLHRGNTTAVLAVYPPDLADTCRRFERTTRLLSDAGIRVPELVAVDPDHRRMLLEDVGRLTLYDRRGAGWSALERHLGQAVDIVERLRTIPADTVSELNPPLGEDLLARELEHTWRVALGAPRLTDVGLPASLEEALGELVSQLAAAPRSVAHRDLMARNLVPLEAEGRLAVLDHQDLRLAPAPYDLASLLNDSLYPPPALEERLLQPVLGDDQRLAYHRAAAQRCLKIVGTFVGFARRGSARHLGLVAPSLERACRHLAALPETEHLASEVDELLRALAAAPRV